jgi:hypothetical protein
MFLCVEVIRTDYQFDVMLHKDPGHSSPKLDIHKEPVEVGMFSAPLL